MYDQLLSALVSSGARRATKYLSEREVVKMTRRVYKLRKGRPLKSPLEVVLTRGRPNYAEREFIRKCKKAGEPFPVRKIQLR